jgi:3-methylfumaryl-CoA hydratase
MDLPESARAAIGKTVAAEDVVTAAPVAAMAATFGRAGDPPGIGDPLPPLWHGMYCTAKLPPNRLGPDGLARDEPLLPAMPDWPRKLFGGARFRFERPIPIGRAIRRDSSIDRFEAKEGRNGPFLVATVAHRIQGPDGIAVLEENDVIFRPPAAEGSGKAESGAGAPPPPFGPDAWRRAVDPHPVLMFRHSALTFNSHRIHYDRDYVRAHGYPGLVVQGTLIARLMLELVRDRRPDSDIAAFSFRAGRPLYDTGPFTIEGEPSTDGREIKLRALGPDGVAMTATAELGAA